MWLIDDVNKIMNSMLIWVIPNVIFIFLIGIITAYLTFLTGHGSLTYDKKLMPWKKLTKRGKAVGILLIAMIIVLWLQDRNNSLRSDSDNLKLKIEREGKDSIIMSRVKSGVDANSKKLFEDLSLAFAGQNLKIDTLKGIVQVVRDSVKVVNNNFSSGDPSLIIMENGIYRKDSGSVNRYIFRIKSADQASTNFQIQASALIKYTNGFQFLNIMDIFPSSLVISKDLEWISMMKNPTTFAVDEIYLYLHGTYTSLDNKRKYPLDQLYHYYEKSKQMEMPSNAEKDSIIFVINSLTMERAKSLR